MKLPVDYNSLNQSERRIVRGEYIRIQNGLCTYCGENLTGPPSESAVNKKITKSLFPPNFFKWPVHLHHDHNTGTTKGAVHNYCNAVLWEYHDE